MIEISSEAVERVKNILSEVPGGAQKALSAAMNRGLAKVRSAAFKKVQTVYTVQYAALKKATKVKVKNTSQGNLAGEISFSGVKIPLYKFKVTPQAIGTRATVKGSLTQGGGMTEFANAYIAMMPNAHIGVFERTGEQSIEARKEAYSKTQAKRGIQGGKGNKHTEKIHELMGLSAAQMISNENIMDKIEADAQETVNVRIEHEIDRILNGYGGKK